MIQCQRCPTQFEEGYYKIPLDFGEGVKIIVRQKIDFTLCPACFKADLQECINDGDPKIREQIRRELREGILPNEVSIGYRPV